MSTTVYPNVPNDQVAKFCKRQKNVYGATKCEAKDNGNGTSSVTVEIPDAEL
jgi:hypothetical protein